MYTTNIIENLNRQYRKVTKGKPIFPTDTSLMKSLYLATENATKEMGTTPEKLGSNCKRAINYSFMIAR